MVNRKHAPLSTHPTCDAADPFPWECSFSVGKHRYEVSDTIRRKMGADMTSNVTPDWLEEIEKQPKIAPAISVAAVWGYIQCHMAVHFAQKIGLGATTTLYGAVKEGPTGSENTL